MTSKSPPPGTLRMPALENDEVLVEDLLDERDRAGKGPKPERLWDFVASLAGTHFDQKEGKR